MLKTAQPDILRDFPAAARDRQNILSLNVRKTASTAVRPPIYLPVVCDSGAI